MDAIPMPPPMPEPVKKGMDIVYDEEIPLEEMEELEETPEEMPEKYDELSSIKRVDGKTPATLLIHGTEDRCVSHEQAVAFYSRLREVGVHAELAIYEGKPHAWFNNEPDKTITLKRMEKFLVARLGLEKDKD